MFKGIPLVVAFEVLITVGVVVVRQVGTFPEAGIFCHG